MSNFKTSLLGATALAMCTLGAPLAMADATVDGVTVPQGNTPGGFVLSTQTLYENVVTNVGDTNLGAGLVNLIGPSAGGSTYFYGTGGVFLNFIVDGFNVARIIAPTATTAGEVDFTGGTVTFYADSAALNTTGTPASVFASISGGGPQFLQLTAEPTTAAGYSIVATLPAGSSTNNFSAIGSTGLFAVTGGDAASLIDPAAFANAFSGSPLGTSPADFAALIFTSSDSTICGTNAFSTLQTTTECTGVSSSQEVYVNGAGKVNFNTVAVPEPASLALLGTGFIGFWAAGRRRSRKSA